ncbi:MAG: hypothetical protein U1F57_01135 [bacterium]
MAKRKRSKKKNSTQSDFLKLLIALGILGGLLWWWKHPAPTKPIRTVTKVATPAPAPKSESKPAPAPETQAPPPAAAKGLTELFPKETWLDDYLKSETPFESNGNKLLLVSLGLAPAGKNPDQIRNPDQLHPALLMVGKQGNEFQRKDLFDFTTSGPTQAGIKGSDLRGLPRITPASFLDLDQDKRPEIVTRIDTHGANAEAIGFLHWNGSKLEWLKTRDKAGNEKIALWLVGATSIESQEITTEKAHGEKLIEVIQKKGVMDPKHPEIGFVWKTTFWRMKDGVLVEK